MHIRRLPAAVLAGITVVSLAACSSSSAEEQPEAARETRTVEHVRGTTEVPADPQRVVVLDTGELDSAVALGVTPVGAVRAPVNSGLLTYLEPELEGVEMVGEVGQPDLEKIAALEPDLILGSELRVADFFDELSAIAPTVFTETVGVTWKENLQVHAAALGREEEAARLLADYERRAQEVGEQVDDGTTVSVVRFVPGEIRLYAHQNFIGTLLQDAGIARPPAQDVDEFAVKISPEQVDQADGDVIIWGSYGDPAETDQAAVLGGPLWQRLAGVQAGEVHEVDDDLWFLGIGIGAADRVLDEMEQILAR